MQAVCVDPKQVLAVWPKAEGLLIHSLSAGSDYTLAQIKDGLSAGQMLLWLAVDGSEILAVVVTKLVVGTNPPEKRCDVITIGGTHLPKWVRLVSTVIDYAKAEQCAAFRITSRRKAWRRILSDFSEPYIILEKRL